MRTHGDDLGYIVCIEGLDIGHGKGLIDILVADLLRRIAAAALFGPEDSEIETGGLEYLCKRDSHFLVEIVKCPCTSHVEEILSLSFFRQDRYIVPLCPVRSHMSTDAPGIRIVFHPLEYIQNLGREVGFHHDQIAPELDEFRELQDICRAGLYTCHTGGTCPDGILIESVTDECRSGILFVRDNIVIAVCIDGEFRLIRDIGAHILDDISRFQRLVGIECRTYLNAASAAHTRLAVDDILPGEFLDIMNSECLCGLEHLGRHGLKRRLRCVGPQEDVDRSHEYMDQLGVRNVDDKCKGSKDMGPPENEVRISDRRLAHA